MEKIIIDSYKLNKIPSRMSKEYGTITKGNEELYTFSLVSMEGNLLKLYRQDSNRTSRHALAAIQMALLTVEGYINEIEYDFKSLETPENQALLEGLLMSFDPYTNPEIQDIVLNETASFNKKDYFITPIKCLLRIEKSINHWTRNRGSNGYFEFIEKHMGHMIKRDNQMNFTIQGKEEIR